MKYKSEFQERIELVEFDNYELAMRQRRMLGRASLEDMPIEVYVLSCPDYTSIDDKYTFSGGVRGGVPLLTDLHLEGIEPLVDLCAKTKTKLAVKVLVADVEAYNQALCNKYTNGDRNQFLARCAESVESIKAEYGKEYQSRGIDFTASTFLDYFSTSTDPEVFLATRALYKEVLFASFITSGPLHNKVTNNIRSKKNGNYYKTEYGEVKLPDDIVLIEREITTMSEYLTLGSLIANETEQSLIVVHGGVNDHLFNARNEYLLPGETDTSKPPIPLLIRQKPVY